ncbi:MAG TPA: serine hydrolase domain-containing protein [Gaiellaceae bacterium]|jgi:CubicO group peptidase (beta-lactamase class C family)|nr:serine hydrolase domain-containing protein [Gaiellaceae bacterium]
MDALQDVVAALADELHVPGVAVGMLLDGREEHACHGVTSTENPLPVNERTLFLCGSTTKTYTATAIARLVGQGLVDLDAPARTYVPELRVEDEEAAASVTVLQLLNHTSGWDGDFFRNTGDGDDALARYVEAMTGLRQLTRPGEAVSYNNAAFGVAGRLVENVTGSTYEAALRELLLEPLDLHDTLFFPRDLLTRRVAVDHQRLQDGGTNILPFGFPRATNPVGGLAATTRDLIAWARFNLGGGSLLSPELARRMQEPTVEAPGWAQGDAVGISWLLSDVAGLRVVGHGGATLGQLSLFKLVPERGFALVSCTNCGPVGASFNERIMQWAWEALLDAPIPEPETAVRTADEVAPYCARYETVANLIDITPSGDGLSLLVTDRPELLEEFGVELEQEPPVPFLFRAGHADRIVCTTPPYRGSSGFFLRDESGRVTAMNAFGRHAVRTS